MIRRPIAVSRYLTVEPADSNYPGNLAVVRVAGDHTDRATALDRRELEALRDAIDEALA